MNFAPNDEQQALIQSTAQFAANQLGATNAFSRARWNAAAAQGLTALPVAAAHGGSGCSALEAAFVFEALGHKAEDSGFVFSLGAHLFAGVMPLFTGGTADQQNEWLPRIASGDCLLANAMTESSSGSDAYAMKTTAVKKDNVYILNGSKQFCTNASVADVLVVYAVTDTAKGFFGGISALLVDAKQAGVTIGPVQEKMGLENSPMAEVFFENVEVNENRLIGKAGSGTMLFQHSMQWERVGLSAWHVGSMQQLIDRSVSYATTKSTGGKIIAEHQAVAFRLADMQTRCEAARMLVHRAAHLLDSKSHSTREAAMAKIFTSEALIKTAQDALLIHGGNGYMKSFAIEHFLRDAMAAATYSGTNDVLRGLVAGQL